MEKRDRRHPKVVNLAEVEPESFSKGARFGAVSRSLAEATGARGIGCSWYEVAPGKTSFPAHWHAANEEAVFVLEGEGLMRIGERKVPVGPGDWISLPTGPEHVHQLVNTGTTPLRYLALSTLHTTEVVGYPDSGKLGLRCGPSAEGMYRSPWARVLVRADQTLDYYDGEQLD